MTSFGWKRKLGEKVSHKKSTAFEEEAKDEDNDVIERGDVDWLTLLPNRKVIRLEDAQAKSARLKAEGSLLAESERYWEAMKKWDEAIQLTPNDETLYEMKAQALIILCEVFPAVSTARKVTELKPTWWVGHQTLGRALLGLGEVRMAVKSFSRAVHLNPTDNELWGEDLMWAVSLLSRKHKLEEEKETSSVKITELDESENVNTCTDLSSHKSDMYSDFSSESQEEKRQI
ncbi:hypothetical protein FSP39_010483 [Pinctada imbricata]|uniref:Tetratricopeptide repeat protein 33 n=1 Tax=Pinctada imbricata TaxID=66713 RepID=A0AA88XR30_PINIB|nr:hypothetical protein FSP39_010483 [Pinctada imbricata]